MQSLLFIEKINKLDNIRDAEDKIQAFSKTTGFVKRKNFHRFYK